MFRSSLLSLALAIAVTAPSRGDEKPALEPGNYIVYYQFNASAPEQAFALIKVEKKGGKLIGSIEDVPQGLKSEMKEFTVDGKNVFASFDLGGRVLTFEGSVPAKDAKTAIGSFGDDRLLSRGRLVATEKSSIERTDMSIPAKLAPPLEKLTKLQGAVNTLRFKVNQAKGEEAIAAAKKDLETAQKELKDENERKPALYREVLEKHGDNPQVIDAAITLLRTAEKDAKPEEVSKWIKSVETFAEPHGARFHMDALVKCSAALASQKGFEAISLDLAERSAKLVTDKTPTDTQVRILKALQTAQEKAGKGDLAKQTAAKLLKLEEQLDKEYLSKVPPFKPTKFAGRKKEGATRVAVLELFTGAYCPPCVAADVAFDALLKSYKPTELVMIQYHMHIPAPDPLTNPDTEARWKYYPGQGGVPSSLFNGKKLGGGGGGMANSEAKFKDYRGFIDPILDEETPIKLSGSVSVKGDKLAISIDVDGLKDSDKDLKLRIVVVEEAVKYVGGNGIRFHHHVARAFAGGADGIALDKNGAKTADVDLSEVRKKLTSYLEDHVKSRGEFGNPDKPLALKDLRVIAFVQDENSKQILQAMQLNVPEAK